MRNRRSTPIDAEPESPWMQGGDVVGCIVFAAVVWLLMLL
jgi:hypothetical protein